MITDSKSSSLLHPSSAIDCGVIRDVAGLKNLGLGRRCFIVATGPSLARLPLERLSQDFIIGVNRSYLALDLGLPRIDMLVIADPAAYRAYHAEIEAVAVGCRLYRSNVHDLVANKGHDPGRALRYPFHPFPWMDEGCFSYDLAAGTYRGCTVVTEALQVAYYMGFPEVYVLGCDLDYAKPSTHFYETTDHEEAHRADMPITRARGAMKVAKSVYNAEGRILLNATAGGSLEEIGRVSFESLFT